MAKKKPFSISPSPSTLYVTDAIQDVIDKVHYVIEDRQGLTAILGDVGHGKSSLLRFLLNKYSDEPEYTTAFISTPTFKSDFAFVKAVANEYELPARKSLYDQLNDFQAFLVNEYAAERNVLLFIDEAHRLDNSMLEQIRGFLNFETDEDKLIQIVMSAQLELAARLRKKTHKAIRSRVLAPSMLATLSISEVAEVLTHRCRIANVPVPFSNGAYERIWQIAGGIPRETMKLAGMCYDIMRRTGGASIDLELINEAIPEFRLLGEDETEEVETEEG